MNTTSGTAPMCCAHCGRPCAAAVWIGSLPYHEECTHGPSWQQAQYAPNYFFPPKEYTVPYLPLTADDVRRIAREEIAKAAPPSEQP
jgi:hypothetical protein